MKIAPLADVKDHFSAYVDESRDSPVVVTRNGRPVALLIAITDDDDLDGLLLAHNPRFVELLDAARLRVHRTGGVSLARFRRQIAVYSAPEQEPPAAEWRRGFALRLSPKGRHLGGGQASAITAIEIFIPDVPFRHTEHPGFSG